jgi:hypothetical protein
MLLEKLDGRCDMYDPLWFIDETLDWMRLFNFFLAILSVIMSLINFYTLPKDAVWRWIKLFDGGVPPWVTTGGMTLMLLTVLMGNMVGIARRPINREVNVTK